MESLLPLPSCFEAGHSSCLSPLLCPPGYLVLKFPDDSFHCLGLQTNPGMLRGFWGAGFHPLSRLSSPDLFLSHKN